MPEIGVFADARRFVDAALTIGEDGVPHSDARGISITRSREQSADPSVGDLFLNGVLT